MNTCNKCQGKFTWAKPYTGDKVPSGDNPCTCDGSSSVPKSTGAPRVEVPIEQIVAEIQAIRGTFSNKDSEGAIIDIYESAAMTEGIWKFAISRKMSR